MEGGEFTLCFSNSDRIQYKRLRKIFAFNSKRDEVSRFSIGLLLNDGQRVKACTGQLVLPVAYNEIYVMMDDGKSI